MNVTVNRAEFLAAAKRAASVARFSSPAGAAERYPAGDRPQGRMPDYQRHQPGGFLLSRPSHAHSLDAQVPGTLPASRRDAQTSWKETV